jgi:glycosyltransferase involved in cell wall biosynthesis
MNRKNGLNVLMFVTPVDAMDSVFPIVKKLVNVIAETVNSLYFVSGGISDQADWPDNCEYIEIKYKLHYVKSMTPFLYSFILWMLKLFFIQMRMAFEIYIRRNEIDCVICYLGYHFQLPALMAKILGIKIISSATGVTREESKQNYGEIISLLLTTLMNFVYLFSDMIIVQSLRMGEYKSLSAWKDKMRLGASYAGNVDLFSCSIPFTDRENIVGYVGRLTSRKGIMEFIDAISFVTEQFKDIRFIVVGRGILDNEARQRAANLGVDDYVKFVGAVSNIELPGYYNKLKLLVIPSTSEGLPNVLLEAFGCHTPVLATPVGAIPDLIIDKETGFLLSDNSPEEISQKILELIQSPGLLNSIIEGADQVVKEKFSFDAAVNRYQKLFDEISAN